MTLIRSESILSKLMFQSPVVLPPPLKLVQPRPSWLDGDVLPIVKNSPVKEDVALPEALLLLKVVRAAEVGSAQVLHHQVQGAELLTSLVIPCLAGDCDLKDSPTSISSTKVNSASRTAQLPKVVCKADVVRRGGFTFTPFTIT